MPRGSRKRSRASSRKLIVMRRLRSEQTGLSYVSTGPEDAPLVVCLHGFPDIPRTWGGLTGPLHEAGYRIVSPWLPGYAPSSLEGPFDIPTLTQTILSFIDELSPSVPVRIVGHDWGSGRSGRRDSNQAPTTLMS